MELPIECFEWQVAVAKHSFEHSPVRQVVCIACCQVFPGPPLSYTICMSRKCYPSSLPRRTFTFLQTEFFRFVPAYCNLQRWMFHLRFAQRLVLRHTTHTTHTHTHPHTSTLYPLPFFSHPLLQPHVLVQWSSFVGLEMAQLSIIMRNKYGDHDRSVYFTSYNCF